MRRRPHETLIAGLASLLLAVSASSASAGGGTIHYLLGATGTEVTTTLRHTQLTPIKWGCQIGQRDLLGPSYRIDYGPKESIKISKLGHFSGTVKMISITEDHELDENVEAPESVTVTGHVVAGGRSIKGTFTSSACNNGKPLPFKVGFFGIG